MQHRWWPIVGVIVSCVLAREGLGAAEPTKPIHTKHTRFRVNFELPSASAAKDEPRKVELHVSSDQGVTWRVAGTAKPADRGILFAAPADGEYWFMPRTKYASGKYLPEGPPSPELKVVVDTTPPVLELEARDEQGEVFVRWHVTDRHLQAETFKLEYRLAGTSAAWQRVAIDALENTDNPDDLHGETTLILPIREQATPIVVRAEAADAAGNYTVKEQPLRPHEAGETAGPPAMPASFAQGSAPTPQHAAPTAYPQTATPDWPAQESAALVEAARLPQPAPTDRPPRHELVNAAIRSDTQRLRDLPAAAPDGDQVPADAAPPPGVQPHLVNKPRFELLYDVEATGSAGIDQVELWMTKNGGGDWSKYGLDEDCRSPVAVTVPGEGLYGFRVVIETTAGLRSPTPVSGDLPDLWVEVDLTKPEVRLISADQGNGDEADRLIVCWEASDRHLAGRGISLRWSASPQGPWNTIASGLENSGRYAWRLDQRVSRQMFLLVEARDEAGNVSSNQLAQPVSLDLIRPQGRIRDVRPLGAATPEGRRL
jgi:hypothetical protein